MQISLFIFYIGASLGTSYQSSGHDCCVRTGYTTPYVTAFQHQMSALPGCQSNQTTPTSFKEVHILRYGFGNHGNRGKRSSRGRHRNDRHGNKKHTSSVTLKLEPRLESGLYENSAVLILLSQDPVAWIVEPSRIRNTSRYKFVLPKTSRILNSDDLGFQVRVKKYDNLPSDVDDLMLWAREKEGVVTSVSNIPKVSSLVLTVGIDPNAPSECQLRNHSPGGSTSPTTAVDYQKETTSACAAKWNEGWSGKDVHIIEVHDTPAQPAPGEAPGSIWLVIMSKSPPIPSQPLLLVLKGPETCHWTIDIRKFRGDLDIITNVVVETLGSPRQAIMITADPLQGTGQEMINWVADSYGHPVSYTEAQVADMFNLYVDGGEGLSLVLQIPGQNDPNYRIGEGCPPSWPHVGHEQHRQTLQQTHTLSCDQAGMVVALPKQTFKDLGVMLADFSLSDRSCGATENGTHFVLTTDFESCGTQKANYVYTNKVFLKVVSPGHLKNKSWRARGGPYRNTIDTEAVLEETEGSGSGFGAGSRDDTFVDDEDLTNSGDFVSIDVMCKVLKPREQAPPTPDTSPQTEMIAHVEYSLELFNDAAYSRPLANRLNNSHIKEGAIVYVQAKIISGDQSLHPMIKSCEIVAHSNPQSTDDRIALFTKGCKMGKKNLVELLDGPSKEKRFSFEILDYWKDGSSPQIVCQLIACTSSQVKYANIPKCVGQLQYCVKSGIKDNKDILVQTKAKTVKSNRLVIISPRKPDKVESTHRDTPVEGPSSTDGSAVNSPHVTDHDKEVGTKCGRVMRVEGLDSGTVVGIAFAAFVIGVLLTGALWYIHTHTGPMSRRNNRPRSAETSGESTPSSTAPITIHQIHRFNPPVALHHCAVIQSSHPRPLNTIHQLILTPLFDKYYMYD